MIVSEQVKLSDKTSLIYKIILVTVHVNLPENNLCEYYN